ncbi:secA translation cis-regulator SecM [Necropsobacter massiliensis]|uniref:secA translation cis-regulator SecM n=1 Tax=Necropsobacter massiliensis TaxID=1400001 RepID=UPI00059625D0|nr:secA translation cis-regulator SecM [Necropsobacter massiliensis]
MTSAKGKQHFWSRLLLSMIAIFALPVAQGLETSGLNAENYANQQRQAQQQIQQAVSLVRQVHRQPLQRPQYSLNERQIIGENRPHFCHRPFYAHAPIRAGPAAI